MKNPLKSTDSRLTWWHNQADEELTPTIATVSAAPRTTIRADKYNRTAIVTVATDDVDDFTDTAAGSWIISRLAYDTGTTRPNPLFHSLIALIWIYLLILGVTTITHDAGTGVLAFVAGALAGIAQYLYLRNKRNHSTTTILNADRNAALAAGQDAAADYFNTRIDGIYRTPIHSLISRRSPTSLTNRATTLGLHISHSGEVTTE